MFTHKTQTAFNILREFQINIEKRQLNNKFTNIQTLLQK